MSREARSARRLQVEQRAIGDLRSDAGNPRSHPPAQLRRLVASIEEFGWTNPILVDRAGVVIAGNARLAAARKLRRASVPVIVLDDLMGAPRRAYQVADNRIALDAEWDEAMLASVIEEISEAGLDLQVTGFGDAELRALLASPEIAGEASEDLAPPAPGRPVTRLGDIWEMGRHRLICGDSREAAVVEMLVRGADMIFTDPPYGMKYDGGRARAHADLVFTDPPYGMAFGAGKDAGSTPKGATVKAHGQILGDEVAGAALIDLVGRALAAARRSSRAGAPVYVCFTWRTHGEFLAALARAGLAPAACIVWDKGSIGLGYQHYRPRHEFIFYCAGAHWYGGLDQGDVWTFSRGRTGGYVHPTQKPVALVGKALVNSSLPGDVVLDVFGGSGSTLMACEELERRARVVELDPKYCDVTVRRWQEKTGRAARRGGDGREFDEVAASEV